MSEVISLHGQIAGELFDKKALSALIWLVDHGHELEFRWQGRPGFISRSGSAKVVSIWLDKKEQAFDSTEALAQDALLGGKPFYQIWEDIELECLL